MVIQLGGVWVQSVIIQVINKVVPTANRSPIRDLSHNSNTIRAIENVFHVCIAWHKHERGWENSRQLCKPEAKSRVSITVENSPNASSVYIRLCKHRKKVFYCFYKITFLRKKAKLFVWQWLKEKFLPVVKSCPRSLAHIISSCFVKSCFPKYGLFSLKMSA